MLTRYWLWDHENMMAKPSASFQNPSLEERSGKNRWWPEGGDQTGLEMKISDTWGGPGAERLTISVKFSVIPLNGDRMRKSENQQKNV